MLVSTAAGSAAYARAMGAAPVPYNTQVLLLVGSNVLQPYGWKSAVLPLQAVIEIKALDPKKRPMNAFLDGELHRDVESLTVRLSRTAAVELAFEREHDPSTKLAKIQFPVIR